MILEQIQRKLFSEPPMRREPLSVQNPMFFMHIPKAAGTSLANLLSNRFPADACLFHADRPPGQKCDVNQYQFISGHLGIEYLKKFHHRPTVVTFLRHPVDRAVSLYYFRRSFRPEDLSNISKQEGFDPKSDRVATRTYFCEQAHRQSLRDLLLKEPELAKVFFVNEQTRYFTGGLSADVSKIDSRACENLAQCEVVGMTERFEESLGLLCHELGWEPFAESSRLNVTRNRQSISELDSESREILTQLLAPDIALYEFAQQLFEQRLQTALNRSPSDNWPSVAPLPDATDFSFDQPFIGAGWHPREKSRATWSSWSGPGVESWLDFRSTAPVNSRLRCELHHHVKKQFLQSLQVRINGHHIALRQRGFPLGRVVLEGDVPFEAISANRERLRIQFVVNNRWRPLDLKPTSHDDRWLGINLRRIQLIPNA